MVLVAGCSWAPRGRSCARREARGRLRLSRCARGRGVIASSACSGPAPLPPRLGMCRWRFRDRLLRDCDVLLVLAGCSWDPRGRSCARREARGRLRLSRCARGQWVIASSACSGPAPLPPRLGMCRGLLRGQAAGGGSGGAADFQWEASDPNGQSRVLGTRMNRNSLAQSSRKETTNR